MSLNYSITEEETKLTLTLPATEPATVAGTVTDPCKHYLRNNKRVFALYSLTSIEIPINTHITDEDTIKFNFSDIKGVNVPVEVSPTVFDFTTCINKQVNPAFVKNADLLRKFIINCLFEIYSDGAVIDKLKQYTPEPTPEPTPDPDPEPTPDPDPEPEPTTRTAYVLTVDGETGIATDSNGAQYYQELPVSTDNEYIVITDIYDWGTGETTTATFSITGLAGGGDGTVTIEGTSAAYSEARARYVVFDGNVDLTVLIGETKETIVILYNQLGGEFLFSDELPEEAIATETTEEQTEEQTG